MKLENIGDIIAVRKLTLVRDGQPSTAVEVLMGRPQRTPDQEDFFCPYQISVGGKVMAMHGIDASQAMLLTLNIIGVELALINRDSVGKLFWDGDKDGNLDF